ncbi:MAG: helix-hairpin-helix domain-containing protein [Candidatus Omnitrophica bacterium]|nr:helix-hairpin-helix domain-containing protein [Candidatus Omnitrophota bacterium]MDD5351739.1 helix-hairpin-helix domain-containing protein [Candidatus Omnitrophota bacterium]MDD5550950.1 helix-hairpin-helix domain-containing protein [Candidatus Omnitrophota bacterium]
MFDLTSQEKKTIIFVLSLCILGIGLDFFRKKADRIDLVNYKALEEQLIKKSDINKAGFSELANIPGVGERLAYSIIDYRKAKGGFKNIEELKEIKGIKDKKLEQLKKYLTLENNSQ